MLSRIFDKIPNHLDFIAITRIQDTFLKALFPHSRRYIEQITSNYNITTYIIYRYKVQLEAGTLITP
jgi:hypothetical protein